MKALVLAPFDERNLDRLREQVDVTYEPWTEARRIHNPKELADKLRRKRYSIVVVEGDFLTADAFAAPSLQLAGVCRNALNLVDVQAATERGIPIIHTPARNAVAVAEFAVGLMLSLARHVPAGFDYVAQGKWTSPIDPYLDFKGRELAGSVVGIVGLGRIGREVARRAHCLRARVIAADPYVSQMRARALGVRLVSRPTLLRQADFVTFHTASTKETERMMDGEALDLLKPTAYLINTGADNIFDYDALVERLRARRIAGAALDVFPGHIMSPESPLRTLDNVILTPHIGGATWETVTRQSRMIVEDIERFLRGERLRRVANPQALTVARGR